MLVGSGLGALNPTLKLLCIKPELHASMHRGSNVSTCVVSLPLVGVNATVAPQLLNPVNSA